MSDNDKMMIVGTVGTAIAFGSWQHSFWAGIWMAGTIALAGTIFGRER